MNLFPRFFLNKWLIAGVFSLIFFGIYASSCSTQVLASGNGLLFVYPEPLDANVEVSKISQDYYPGIGLEPGNYLIKISKAGYEKYEKRIYIESGEIFDLFVELKKSKQWTDQETGIQFVWVPEGCFEMGCGSWAADCEPDEIPVHNVCLNGFWMSKYEITQGVWVKIMGENPSRFQKGDHYPVEQVSWHKAMEFVSKLKIAGGYSVRLPTEAEWEYAARGGGKKEIYAGGDEISPLGWYQSNSQGNTQPVGKKKANFFGLHDMSGNVWEWCRDIYDKDAYSQSPGSDLTNTAHPVFRVRRGGSWESEKNHLRSLFRGRYPPDLQFESNGLRILIEPY